MCSEVGMMMSANTGYGFYFHEILQAFQVLFFFFCKYTYLVKLELS